MSRLSDEYVRSGTAAAQGLMVGGDSHFSTPVGQLSREELIAVIGHQARALRELRESRHYTHRVAIAANEERA